MRYYESIFILNPDLPSEESERIKEAMGGIVRRQGGEIHLVDDWGLKKLAYNVGKHGKGRYVFMQFRAPEATVQELERNYRVNDGVIKYMTLVIDKKDLETRPPQEIRPSFEAPLSRPEAGPEPERTETGE